MITPGIFKYLKKRSKGMYVHLETRKVRGISEQRIDWDDSDTQPMSKAETNLSKWEGTGILH